ncbi:ATPase P [Ahniella affigens]|uniref:ATPase P n=1 Tax=Ahniella affigens TaxID=2021234 RepID=A0A2P1PP41_9GAMM|nr:heavy metal translocating P-type ATPase [Ahniella affigens]AVP96613.1 ATPase P [Ahniella affigens]
MNTLNPALAGTNAGCFHCGEPLTGPALLAKGQRYCCTGCLAAAEFIHQQGLGDYYRLRTERGSRPEHSDLSVFDRPEVQARYAEKLGEQCAIELAVEGMHCAACAWLIGETLRRLPGVTDASASVVSARLRLVWTPGAVQLSDALQRVETLGYGLSLAGTNAQQEQRRKARRTLMLRLGIAALATMQAMMFSEALYLDKAGEMSVATRDFFRWLTFLMSTPVLSYSAWPFWRGALNEWRLRRFGMDTLAAVSIALAYGASLVETIRGGPFVWFDAAVMFVFFLLLARSLEGMLRSRGQAQLDRMAAARPALAMRRVDDRVQTVPAEEIAVGDVVLVAAGATVPADGKLCSHAAQFDESLLHGESRPQARLQGDRVLAGSICLNAQIEIQVTAVGAETRLSEIERAMLRAAETRPAMARWLDRLVQRFVLIVFGLAIVTAIGWSVVDPSLSLPYALAVLMVSCPCALALAIPTAILAAQSKLVRAGVLCLDTDALLKLRQLDRVVFDKTGTLTEGHPRIAAVDVFGAVDTAVCLALARALEQHVHHPIAEAFAGASPYVAEHVVVTAGAGVSGHIDGQSYRLGSADFCDYPGSDRAGVFLRHDAGILARFRLSDALRPEASAVVASLQSEGLAVTLLSGDQSAAVQTVADQIGVADARSSLSPEAKLATLQQYRQAGQVVAMLGDGINDAPVLAAADVGFTLAKAAPLAQHASALIALNGSLEGFLVARRMSAALHDVIRQNLGWALGYNVLMLPLAAFGVVGPGLAAIGMSVSSLFVTLNAMRLYRQ